MCKNIFLLKGGLGNQLFILLKVMTMKNESLIYTGMLDLYNTKRNVEIESFMYSSNNVKKGSKLIIFFCRLLDIIGLKRLNLYKTTLHFDYFQDLSYESQIVIIEKLKAIRQNFKYSKKDKDLIHIRLKDFNLDDNKIINFIEGLKNFNSSIIMTDDEDRIKILFSKRGFTNKIHSTVNMNSVEVLEAMMSYKSIHSNGSTLAFWAALLSGCLFTSTVYILQRNYNMIYD